jgi:anti-sigma B factor antagonist
MTIDRITENDSITLELSGELTALTAEQLDTAIEAAVGETSCLVLDFKDMEYVASAGLRVLLRAQKTLNAKSGKLIIRNVSEVVMNVFEITGFSNMLDIR